MKIKHPVNFAIGVFCWICFVVNIVKGRDAFTLCFSAIATALNIIIGLIG